MSPEEQEKRFDWLEKESEGTEKEECAEATARHYERGVYDNELMSMLEQATYDSVVDLPCGCRVEPDGGPCEHGNLSPLVSMGMI